VGFDLLLLSAAALCVWSIGGGHSAGLPRFLQTVFTCWTIPLVVLALMGRYDSAPRRGLVVLGVAALGTLAGWLLALSIGGGLHDPAASRLANAVASTGFIALATSAVSRRAFGARAQRVLIVGASDLGFSIAREIRARAGLALELVGFLSDDDALDEETLDEIDAPLLGPVHHLEKVVNEGHVDRVVVASKNRSELFPADELLALKTRGRAVESGVAFYEALTGKIFLRDLRPSYLVFSEGFRMSLAVRAAKRAIDVALAGIGLIAAAPVLALCAIAIKLDSPGPVLFRQTRVGRDGRLFSVTKLRTMRRDAEAGGPSFARRGDARITRVGRFLRRSRLDEVPQLWSILRGDMTLVGPRPERPEFVDSLSKDLGYFRLRTAVRPGLTGWAQVNNGYAADAASFEEKLSYDLFYMKHCSLGLDFVVMLRTIREMLLFKGV
jgi:exopolysaccharide biosynthesis polyprenyl glycosylphosphotransferase